MAKDAFTVDDLLRSYPASIQALAAQLRDLLLAADPAISHKANRGWRSISFRHPEIGYFCGIFPFDEHADLVFEFGALLPDPEQALEGRARQVRFLRFRDALDIKADQVSGFVKAALNLPTDYTIRRALTRSKQGRAKASPGGEV